jgi:hypothetical protein
MSNITEVACFDGHLGLLIWSQSMGYLRPYLEKKPIVNDLPILLATISGQLDICKFLLQQGFKLNRNIAMYAASNGQLEILRWIFATNGTIEDVGICRRASTHKHHNVLAWIKYNGCICNGEYH